MTKLFPLFWANFSVFAIPAYSGDYDRSPKWGAQDPCWRQVALNSGRNETSRNMTDAEWAHRLGEERDMYRATYGPGGRVSNQEMAWVNSQIAREQRLEKQKAEQEKRAEIEYANELRRHERQAGIFTFNLDLISLEDFHRLKTIIVRERTEQAKSVFVDEFDQNTYGELDALFPVWKGVTYPGSRRNLRSLRELGARGSQKGQLIHNELRRELWGLCEVHLSKVEWDVFRTITGLFNTKAVRPTPTELSDKVMDLANKYSLSKDELSKFYKMAKDRVELQYYRKHTSLFARYRGDGRVQADIFYMP